MLLLLLLLLLLLFLQVVLLQLLQERCSWLRQRPRNRQAGAWGLHCLWKVITGVLHLCVNAVKGQFGTHNTQS